MTSSPAAPLVNDANRVSEEALRPRRSPQTHDRRRDRRRDRYELRAVLWDVSTLPRLCGCGRWMRKGAEAISICRRNDGSAYFDGVQTCGSIWACPVCGAKIRQRRGEEIRAGVVRHLANGGGVALGLLTLPHDVGDRLGEMWDAVRLGWKRVQSGRQWQRLKEELGLVGFVRSFEVTHGPNGWHPHLHTLYLFDRPPSVQQLAHLESFVFGRWASFIEVKGYRRPQQKVCGVELVRCEEQLGDYLAKVVGSKGWDVPLEMTRHDLKEGRTITALHRTPWQVLRAFSETGDTADLALWHEYEQVTKGKRAIEWSRGLKVRLGVAERSDDELAEEQQDGACIAMLTPSEWVTLARRPGALCDLLEAAETCDPAEVRERIHGLLYRPRDGP